MGGSSRAGIPKKLSIYSILLILSEDRVVALPSSQANPLDLSFCNNSTAPTTTLQLLIRNSRFYENELR